MLATAACYTDIFSGAFSQLEIPQNHMVRQTIMWHFLGNCDEWVVLTGPEGSMNESYSHLFSVRFCGYYWEELSYFIIIFIDYYKPGYKQSDLL